MDFPMVLYVLLVLSYSTLIINGIKIGHISTVADVCWEATCEDICSTSGGLYRCTCNPKVVLLYDGKSCRTKGNKTIFVSTVPLTRLVRDIFNSPQYGKMVHILDKHTSIEYDADRALHSLPDGFVIKKSPIFEAGLGVFTEKLIPNRTVIGPYYGVRYKDSKTADKSGYSWMVRKKWIVDMRISHYVDAGYPSLSSWVRYINMPLYESDGNLNVFQHERGVYYMTNRSIQPGQELLVWYGNSYAMFLGLDMEDPQDEYF